MTISELIKILEVIKKVQGDCIVGYDSGAMTFTGEYEVETRIAGKTVSLDGEYNS